jgi:carbamoyltransferase
MYLGQYESDSVMIILGISHLSPADGLHDVCTALVIDGKISSSVSEERLNGIKHSLGYPSQGIKFCLQKEGIRLSDVDKVIVGVGPSKENIDQNYRK